MPVETVLAADVAPGEWLTIDVPDLVPGHVNAGTGAVTVGEVAQGDDVEFHAKFSVEFLTHKVKVQNAGDDPWAAGEMLRVTWEGAMLEHELSTHDAHIETLQEQIAALESRLAALEAAPPQSPGSGGDGIPASGGTFTGPVVFSGSDADSFAMEIVTENPADGCSIRGKTAGEPRWEVSLGDPTADANFAISRYPTWGSDFPLDSPLVIYRATGFIKLILTERADSEAAGAAGVPIGGLYSTNGTVRIRTY